MVLLDISPLRHREFRNLFFSQLISMLGSQMTMITIPFQIYSITHSTLQTGLVSAVELVCLVCTALWGGALADKFDRRRIIIVSEILISFLILLLALNATLASPSIILIYCLAGIVAGINGFHRPAFEALTPLLVPKSEIHKISSLVSFKFIAGSLIGPTIAGFLVASVGPVYTYLIDAFSFALSLYLLFGIKARHLIGDKEEASRKSMLREIAEGAQYIWRRKDILGSYIIDFFAMVFCMPQVLFPAFAQHYAHTQWLGALYTSIALGGLLATVVSRWTASVNRLGVAIFCAASGWAFAILLIGLVENFWIIPFGLFIAGTCDGYSGIFRMTMWNESLPDSYRGRIASFGMLSYTSGPLLGNALMGLFANVVGLHQALALGGTISIAAMTFVVLFLPAFWEYRSPAKRNN